MEAGLSVPRAFHNDVLFGSECLCEYLSSLIYDSNPAFSSELTKLLPRVDVCTLDLKPINTIAPSTAHVISSPGSFPLGQLVRPCPDAP